MLYSIEMEVDNLEIEIRVASDGAIESIFVDGKMPNYPDAVIINDHLEDIQEEIAWQWYNDQTKRRYEERLMGL